MGVSTVALPRILRKFESMDGTYAWEFPLIDYEREVSQPLLTPTSPLIGAEFGFDMLGERQAIRSFGEERIRFSVYSKCSPAELDEELDNMVYQLFKAGRGKGWTVNSQNVRQWAEMRLIEMPTYTISNINDPRASKLIGCVATFRVYTPWFRSSAITHTQTITASPTTYTVNNPGRDTATRMIIRFRANTSVNMNDFLLENLTTGKEFEAFYPMSIANDEVKLNTKVPSIEISDDNGASYDDGLSWYIFPPSTQRILSFDLAPGDNSLRFTSTGPTVRVNVEIEADAPA